MASLFPRENNRLIITMRLILFASILHSKVSLSLQFFFFFVSDAQENVFNITKTFTLFAGTEQVRFVTAMNFSICLFGDLLFEDTFAWSLDVSASYCLL